MLSMLLLIMLLIFIFHNAVKIYINVITVDKQINITIVFINPLASVSGRFLWGAQRFGTSSTIGAQGIPKPRPKTRSICKVVCHGF